MPVYDRTGPSGYGPGTGRGMGPCGAGMAWRRKSGQGFLRFWRGFKRGPGRSLDYDSYASRAAEDNEAEMLAEKAKALEEELKAVRARIAGLKMKE